MRFVAPLLRNVLASLAAGSLVTWYLFRTGLSLRDGVEEALRGTFLPAFGAQLLAVALLLARAARPITRAAAARWQVTGAELTRAVEASHRLPAVAALLAALSSAATSAVAVLAMRARGLPPDLAVAAAAVGVAAAILSAMLAYSIAAAAAARASEALGGSAVAARGTVRGKILALGFGLNTIGVLLFAAAGYVRYRGDVDREYVAAARRAQESAVAAPGARPDPELAEHVWLVTSTPTALVGGGGGVVARFGAGAVPFDRARAAPGAAVRLDGGWIVSTRTPGGGLVASWLPEEPLRSRRRAFWLELAAMSVVVYVATAVLAWLAARAITLPLRTLGLAADRIASGDLTASPPSLSRDEMGRLAADFRRMTQGLKGLVAGVQRASEGVSLGAREAGAIGERVHVGALDQHDGVRSVQGAVEAMEGSVHLVSRGVGGLSEYVAATTQAMVELAAASEEVQRKGAELERAMDAAMVDVGHLASAGRDAEGRLAGLEDLAGRAGGTLLAVRASMGGLERAAADTETTAGSVAELADRANGVVEETVHGIETLRAAVADAHRRIAVLGRRSDDIDQVVDFIAEVAGRTNLLSLNASIIAAQAGEHGKAFAVVAEQIRELATQIARSTKSIGDIIHAVREDVEGTAALIDRGDALAVEGVQLARNSLEALGQIQRSTSRGRETAGAIRAAVEAHARSAREISQVVESVAGGSRAVSAAVQLVGRSVAGVNSMSRSVGGLADEVARALEEQSAHGRRQMESLARLERMIADITRAVESHDAATRRVRDALRSLGETAGAHEVAVEGLSGVAERLGGRARELAESVGRFKV